MQGSAAGRKSGALASASATSPIELRRRGLGLLRAQAGKLAEILSGLCCTSA